MDRRMGKWTRQRQTSSKSYRKYLVREILEFFKWESRFHVERMTFESKSVKLTKRNKRMENCVTFEGEKSFPPGFRRSFFILPNHCKIQLLWKKNRNILWKISMPSKRTDPHNSIESIGSNERRTHRFCDETIKITV